jgi:O-antigen/teichoic acid export membrane protein
LKTVEKALEMGKTSATGSFQLLIGVAVSTVIMAVGTIILGRLLTPADYGLYGIVQIPIVTINLFRDWGINSAMTKYIASLRASHKEEEIPNFIAAGLLFEAVSGIVLTFLSFALATFIAATVFHRPESVSFIEVISISIIAGSLLTASQGVFVGFERMELNSLTLVCNAIVKTIIGPILVFLGYSVLGAVVGYSLGFVAAGIIGVTTFYFVLYRPLRKKGTKNDTTKTLKIMLNYGVPLFISTILSGILGAIYLFIVPSFVSNAVYGNYLTAFNFTVLLTFISTPIATVLFPAFAKLDSENDDELVRTVFTSSIKYTSILLVPATMIMMALSSPIIGALYGTKYVSGPFFLTIAVIGNLFALFGNLSLGSFLSGLGQTRILMIQSVITIIIGLPLGFLLIPTLGITGLIIANITAGVPSMVWALNWIWKHYKTKADFHSSAKIFTASILAAIPAYLTTVFLQKTFEHPTVRAYVPWIELAVGLIVFLVIYVLGAPIIGAVSQSDIDALRHMFSNLGIVSRIINIPLKAAEKAAKTKSAKKEVGEKP